MKSLFQGLGSKMNGKKLVKLGKTNKMKVWKNTAGEWCIGNKCFRIRAAEDGTHVAFNPNSRGCPVDMRKAAEALMKTAKAGKETVYHRIPEEW